MGTQISGRGPPRSPLVRMWFATRLCRSKSVGHNDRRPQGRQARGRKTVRGAVGQAGRRKGALSAAIAIVLLTGTGGVAAEPERAPLEIQRQQNDSRLDAIERKGERQPPGAELGPRPPAPYDHAPPPAGPPPDQPRQDLERRAREDRQRTIGRDLDRLGGQTNPSSSGLLDRLRRD